MAITPKLILSLLVGLIILGGFWLLRGNDNKEVIATIPARDTTTGAVKIIAFGDSLTAGFGLPQSESYPAQLEMALKEKGLSVTMINSGVSGETTRGNLERAQFIRDQNPDIVLLGIGGNDALRALPLGETKKNLNQTITTLKDGVNPPVVILLQMQSPLNAGRSYKQEFDGMYKELAATHQLILVPFITMEVFMVAANKLPDGIHLNQIGYQKVVELYLLEPVSKVVGRLGG
jgi:acyl-CoA thioesterase-1